MDIRRFDHALDLRLVEGWLDERGIQHERGRSDLLPPTGFIVDDSLAGFLYRTDAPGVAYLDGFVGRPSLRGERAEQAMRILVKVLQDEARSRGVKVLFGSTSVPSILRACEANGWTAGTGRVHTNMTFTSITLREREQTQKGT